MNKKKNKNKQGRILEMGKKDEGTIYIRKSSNDKRKTKPKECFTKGKHIIAQYNRVTGNNRVRDRGTRRGSFPL